MSSPQGTNSWRAATSSTKYTSLRPGKAEKGSSFVRFLEMFSFTIPHLCQVFSCLLWLSSDFPCVPFGLGLHNLGTDSFSWISGKPSSLSCGIQIDRPFHGETEFVWRMMLLAACHIYTTKHPRRPRRDTMRPAFCFKTCRSFIVTSSLPTFCKPRLFTTLRIEKLLPSVPSNRRRATRQWLKFCTVAGASPLEIVFDRQVNTQWPCESCWLRFGVLRKTFWRMNDVHHLMMHRVFRVFMISLWFCLAAKFFALGFLGGWYDYMSLFKGIVDLHSLHVQTCHRFG